MSSPENALTGPNDTPAAGPPAAPGDFAPAAAPSMALKPAGPPPALAAAPNAFLLARALRRRWLLAGTMGLTLGAAAAAAVWFALPPAKNSANVQFHMNSNSQGTLNKHPDHIENFDTYQRTQVALIKSRLVLNSALRQPGVARLDTFKGVADPVEWLEREVRVDYPSPEILRITVTGEDVDELKVLADAVKKAYLTEIVEKETRQRQTSLENLRKIQEHYRTRLAGKRHVWNELAKRNGAVDPKQLGFAALLMREQQATTRTELIKVQEQLRDLETREKLAGGVDGVPDVPAKMIDAAVDLDQGVQKHLAKIAQWEDLLSETRKAARDAENLKGVKRIKEDIEAEQLQLKALRARLRPQVETRVRDQALEQAGQNSFQLKAGIAHLRALEKSLLTDIQKYNKAIEDAPAGQIDLRQIEFEIEQCESEVKKASEAINALEVEIDDPPRVTLLQDAVAYRADNFARKAQAAAAAGVGLLGLSLAGVAFLEFRSRRVDSVEEIVHGLGVRVVGTVPACPRRFREGVAGGGKISYWKSMLAESVDAARTLLLHHARREDLRTVMVTSACGGEGKTSLSSHLAVSMARAGRKTLLLDCDLRNPSAHKLFNVPLGPGLSAVLRGEVGVTEALQPTRAEGLWLMPAGTCDGEALRTLSRGGMTSVFEQLRGEFDFIVVDTSPVLPVADTLMVAQQVDGVLFAILKEVSRLPKVHEAYQKLLALGVRVLGAVVNGTSSEVYGYGYGYGNGNGRYLTPSKS